MSIGRLFGGQDGPGSWTQPAGECNLKDEGSDF